MTKPPQRAIHVPMSDTRPQPDAIAHAWARVGAALSPHPDCPLPTWTGGGDTLHRHLLVIGSGHDGDLVSQLRYLKMASARFRKVGFVGPANVRRLVEWSMGERVVVISRLPRDVSDWDLRCPIGTLARALGPQAASTHAGRPHLRVTMPAARHWRDRLAAAAQHGLCVGFAGYDDIPPGVGSHPGARRRVNFAPLLRVPGVSWVPLGQRAPGEADIALPASIDWIDWRADFDDLADEASLIDNLDLVISLQPPQAHLARGLGVPVWQLTTPTVQMPEREPHDPFEPFEPFDTARFGIADTGDEQDCGMPWPRDGRPGSVDAAARALIAMATEFQGWTR